jgi:hypothetical protein
MQGAAREVRRPRDRGRSVRLPSAEHHRQVELIARLGAEGGEHDRAQSGREARAEHDRRGRIQGLEVPGRRRDLDEQRAGHRIDDARVFHAGGVDHDVVVRADAP